MSRSVVGKWGKNLAIRVPMDVARAACLMDGEKVEIETLDGDIVVRRRAAHAQAVRTPRRVSRRSLLKAPPIRWAGFPFGSCWTTDDGGEPHPLFHEYYHRDNGRGLGASHQTGWSAAVALLIQMQGRLL